MVAFNNQNEVTVLTRKRKAGILLEKVETVYSRKQQLKEAFEKLMAHAYELEQKDFDPQTPPEEMVNQIERNMTELSAKAENTLSVYEEHIVAAEKVMSL